MGVGSGGEWRFERERLDTRVTVYDVQVIGRATPHFWVSLPITRGI